MCLEDEPQDNNTKFTIVELSRYKNADGMFGCDQAQRAKDLRSE